MENYFTIGLGFFVLIIGLLSMIKPKLFISKGTPKIHPFLYIETEKYIRIRGWVFTLFGSLMVIFFLLDVLGKL